MREDFEPVRSSTHCEVVPINGPRYRLKNRLQVIESETDVA